MPLLEYICPTCNLAWTLRVPATNATHDFQKCKKCGNKTKKSDLPSSLAVQRTGTSAATLDHKVGQDASQKWDSFHQRKEERDTVRKESGSPALSQQEDGSYAPASPELIALRKKVYESLK